LSASLARAQVDPALLVNGVTVGVATMHENSPHAGEMHPDGDKVLYLISGRLRVTLDTATGQRFEMGPGDGLIVPRGIRHRVDIIEPCQIVYVTPGPNGQYRPLADGG
jgi:quercetin dioxygenase-like cupin family protein